MKYLALALVFGLGYLTAQVAPRVLADNPNAPPARAQPRTFPPNNPAIDMPGYLKIAQEAEKHRATHRVTEEEFIKMSAEEGTIVLDARSKDMFDLLHIKGAVNLSFPNIDMVSLPKVLPDKNARILIYCNNNFTDPAKPAGKGRPAEAFRPKSPVASLNISTYIALYGYGYKNVYELAPLVDPAKTKLTLEATPAK